MELFDIIKSFTNDSEWKKVTETEKSRNFFMINRIMSINFPLQGNAFNHTKIEPAKVVDWWRAFIKSKYKTPPPFIWTSTIKKKKEIKKEAPEEVLRFICEKHEISMREIKDLQKFFPKEFMEYCENVKEIIS
jgi:hypothetical protein